MSHRANQDQSDTNFRRFGQRSKCPTERIKIKLTLTFAVFGKGASVPHDAATQLAGNSGHSETPRQSCADSPRPLSGHRVHVHDVRSLVWAHDIPVHVALCQTKCPNNNNNVFFLRVLALPWAHRRKIQNYSKSGDKIRHKVKKLDAFERVSVL